MTLWNIIHGAEFWLALALFNAGAFFGILFVWIMWGVGERRKKK